jgi:hypothetical protein
MADRPRIEQRARLSRPKLPEDRDAQADFAGEFSPSAHLLLALSEALPVTAPPVNGAERLARAVTELPLRYAPFYVRLSNLWHVPECDVERELTRARDPRSWSLTLLRGVKTFEVGAGTRSETRRRLLHFSAGVHFPKHRHRGEERVLVLEGSYADSSGCQVRAGEEQRMTAGSEHELTVLGSQDCVAAVAEQGLDFTGPLLRWATKLLG